MILRAKSGISKIAELQFYFSATTNFQKVPESAGDHGVFFFFFFFCISDCSAKAKL